VTLKLGHAKLRIPFIFQKGATMILSISEKGKRVVKLIKAVKAAGVLVPGNKVLMPDERPATYIGPVMEGGVQMHEFRLFDETEVVLEVPALNREPRRVALLMACEVSEPAS
jgi:hypothetical protein